jgi:4-amino-4-deoxy-L-arabinose transferase-like glycosyltransferase
MRRAFSESRIVHVTLLALPFIAVIIAWGGLRHGFPAYQYGDERTHYQVVHDVARIWPRAIFWGYQAWSGPFVYWLLATLSLPFGGSLVAVRLVVAALSWGTCVVAYVILRDRLGARPRDAFGLALVLALSPFFFGQSFRVLTDNPAWFFVALALERLIAYARAPQLRRLVVFAVFAAIATTMRQNAAWLFVPAAVALAAERLPVRRRLTHGLVLAAGLVPLAALVIDWGGLLPRGNHPYPETGGAPLRNLLMSFAVVGAYGLLVVPLDEIKALPGRLGRRGGVVVGVVLALVLGALVAHSLRGVIGADPYDLGWLSLVGSYYPGPVGTSLIWWVLVPVGTALVAALAVTRTALPVDRALVVSLVALLATTVVNLSWYQRYVDFPVLLILAALAVGAGVRLRSIDRVRWLVAVVLSVGWIVAYARTTM